MTTTNIHLEPARRIRQAFIVTRRSGESRDGIEELVRASLNPVRASLAREWIRREQGSLLQESVVTFAAPTVEKNGTGIEKNGTGIVWEEAT